MTGWWSLLETRCIIETTETLASNYWTLDRNTTRVDGGLNCRDFQVDRAGATFTQLIRLFLCMAQIIQVILSRSRNSSRSCLSHFSPASVIPSPDGSAPFSRNCTAPLMLIKISENSVRVN